MKIHPKQERIFFEKDFAKYTAILFFGNDESLILNKIKLLENKSTNAANSFEKITLNLPSIEEDLSILYNETASLSLFNKKKFIVIENTPNSISKTLKDFILNFNSQEIVVFKAGSLAPSSSFRKLFESGEKLASVACYPLEQDSIKSLVLQKLEEHKVKFLNEHIAYIVSNLRGEYSTILSEIEKILLYAKNNNDIKLEEIKNIISGPSEKNSYDLLITNIIKQNFIAADYELKKLTDSGLHLVAITRNIATYFVRLLKVKTLISQGANETVAIDSLKPPVFFKSVPDFKIGLKSYTIPMLIEIIEKLTILEMDLKSKNINPELLWEKFYYQTFLQKRALLRQLIDNII